MLSLVYSKQNLDTNYYFLYLLSLIMCERVGKKTVRTLWFMHQTMFRPDYIFDNNAYFFSRTKNPFNFFLNLNPF